MTPEASGICKEAVATCSHVSVDLGSKFLGSSFSGGGLRFPLTVNGNELSSSVVESFSVVEYSSVVEDEPSRVSSPVPLHPEIRIILAPEAEHLCV